MTSPLASVTFKMVSTRKVFVEETDENFEFLTDILFRFLTFDDAKIPIVSIVKKIRPSSHIAGHTFEGQCTSKFRELDTPMDPHINPFKVHFLHFEHR